MKITHFGIQIKKIRNNFVFKLDGITFYASLDEAYNIINEHLKK